MFDIEYMLNTDAIFEELATLTSNPYRLILSTKHIRSCNVYYKVSIASTASPIS